jgi:hypothetical protein
LGAESESSHRVHDGFNDKAAVLARLGLARGLGLALLVNAAEATGLVLEGNDT